MIIIGYGSLMSKTSLQSTLGRPASLRKTTLTGYARIFNAPFDGYAFLNLTASPGTMLEVAEFDITPPELELFAVREAGSVLIEVSSSKYAFVWPDTATAELAVLRSYVDHCRQGAGELGINFHAGLILPERIEDDMQAPIYV